VLVAGGVVAFRVAVGVLRDRVIEGLGPASEIAEIRVGWSSVDVAGLRIPRAAAGARGSTRMPPWATAANRGVVLLDGGVRTLSAHLHARSRAQRPA
jgi:hypothetical protein